MSRLQRWIRNFSASLALMVAVDVFDRLEYIAGDARGSVGMSELTGTSAGFFFLPVSVLSLFLLW
jgi:hypothetical protein